MMADKPDKAEKIDKSFVGKYVCYAKEDGSFTWGRVKDQGFVNTSKGEREVFIMTDQIVCRVANNALELASIKALGNRIAAGTAGPKMLPGPTDPDSLPSYQQFGERKLLAAPADKPEEKKFLLAPASEKKGLIPRLERVMSRFRKKSPGLPMMQKVGMVESSVDGHEINFALRRFGYDTIVHKGSLNLEKDIIDVDDPVYDGMTDGEVFLVAMRAKLANTQMSNVIGHKPLALNEGEKK
jgi:hypothetical protein